MPRFNDRTGRTWTFDFTVGTLRRVQSFARDRDGKPVDVLGLLDDPERALRLAVEDPVALGDVLYACVRPSAAAIGPEEFHELLDAESLAAGLGAVMEGVVSFSRTPELRRALEWLPTAMTEGLRAIELTRLRAIAEAASRSGSGVSSGAAPESSESTPTA